MSVEAEVALAEMKRRAEAYYAWALGTGEKRRIEIAKFACEQAINHNEFAYLRGLVHLRHIPVMLDEFLHSNEFMGNELEVWPGLMPDLLSMNPDVFSGASPTHEALLGGATGTGKTTLSQVTTLYQCYLLSCFHQPQRVFKLTSVTPIVFLLQSVSTTTTKRVIYDPIRALFLRMPYVQKWVGYDKYKESTLELANGVVIAPVQANIQAQVGQAIIGGILDEVNFLAVIDNSKQVPGSDGQGGKFDQAELVYRNMSRRRKSRFAKRGYSIGCICVVSSTRYKGDFLDRRMAEADKFEEKNVVRYRRRQYDVRPAADYSGEKFRLLIGTDEYPTRVLLDSDVEGLTYPKDAQIEMVPIEYLSDFQRDPEAAQRDVIGLATNAITPFFARREKIVHAVYRGEERGLRKWVEKDVVDLAADGGLPRVIEENLPDRKDLEWYFHVDLSTKKDMCGIAAVAIQGYQHVIVDPDQDLVETLPRFVVGLALGLKPSPMVEVDIGDVRRWIMKFANKHGITIGGVSYDGWQSKESQQVLRRAGVVTREISMDKSMEPYEYFRRTVYEDRVDMIDNENLRVEMVQLEHMQQKGKVDHPPRGSKDIADAVCGAIYAAATSRGARTTAGYSDTSGNKPKISARSRRERPAGRRRPLGRMGRG